MAIIFLGWLQPKKFYMLVIFGLPYSKIALRPLKNSQPVKSFGGKHVPTQLHFIPFSSLTPLQNGASILCNVSILLMLESGALDTMIANDCQALLFNYINNILVCGTPLFNLWHYDGEATLIFCLHMYWLRHIFQQLIHFKSWLKCLW
jgi:hypothetical protein